jgi:hypothetical protein
MSEYEVRKGFTENLQPEKLKAIMREAFGNAEERDGAFVATFGALKEVRIVPGKKAMAVETKMDPSVSDEVAGQTIKAYNVFLEKATGYNAKERGKRAQKKAKEGKL